MKFNLKNRPKCDDYAGQYVIYEKDGRKYKGYCHKDMEKWFRGFEKELRERLTQLEQGKRKTDNAVVIASRLSLTYLIKEILGES